MTPEERAEVSARARQRRAVREINAAQVAENKRRGRANRAYHAVYDWTDFGVEYGPKREKRDAFMQAMFALSSRGDRLWADATKVIPRVKSYPSFAAAAWIAVYCGHDPDKVITIAKLILPGKVKA